MNSIYRKYSILRLTLLFILFICAIPAQAQTTTAKDSAAKTIKNLSSLYKKGVLTEKQYLDTIPAVMKLFQSKILKFSHQELLDLLSEYRRLIWDNDHNEKFKNDYYHILCKQAQTNGRNGEMFYYAERLSEPEKANNSFSVSTLLYISTYYYSHLAYAKSIAMYDKYRAFIISIPEMVLKKQLERSEIMRSGDMLCTFGEVSYILKDSSRGDEIASLIKRMIENAAKAYPGDKEIAARLAYSALTCNHQKNMTFHRHTQAWNDFIRFSGLLNDPNTPEYLKGYIQFTLVDRKVDFFIETKQNDSAEHYIGLMYQLLGTPLEPTTACLIKKNEAKLLYNKGLFRQSNDTLFKTLEMMETTAATALSEIDEVTYVLTKVEEQHLLLEESAKKQKESDRKLAALGLGAIILLSGSFLTFRYIRQRQKMLFLEFQLNLARNIHDETNPALLYARMLAKSQRPDPDDKSELEQHIEHTMELTRSLAHDLKSTQHLTVGDLIADIKSIVEKMSVLSGFSYSIEEPSNKKRFLSHYQAASLKAILQECISNSIKHAEFRKITIVFSIEVNALKISYSDDGPGWDKNQNNNGIGLKNIEDRIQKLSGTVAIENNYPDGYQIKISTKLR